MPDPRDAQAEFLPKQLSYSPGDVVTWSCSRGYGPSVVSSRCTQWGNWSPRSVQCVSEFETSSHFGLPFYPPFSLHSSWLLCQQLSLCHG